MCDCLSVCVYDRRVFVCVIVCQFVCMIEGCVVCVSVSQCVCICALSVSICLHMCLRLVCVCQCMCVCVVGEGVCVCVSTAILLGGAKAPNIQTLRSRVFSFAVYLDARRSLDETSCSPYSLSSRPYPPISSNI